MSINSKTGFPIAIILRLWWINSALLLTNRELFNRYSTHHVEVRSWLTAKSCFKKIIKAIYTSSTTLCNVNLNGATNHFYLQTAKCYCDQRQSEEILQYREGIASSVCWSIDQIDQPASRVNQPPLCNRSWDGAIEACACNSRWALSDGHDDDDDDLI